MENFWGAYIIFGDVTDSFVDYGFYGQCVNSSIECEENDVVIEIFECLKDKFGKCLVDINNLTELEELIGSYKIYARHSIFSQLLKVPKFKIRKNFNALFLFVAVAEFMVSKNSILAVRFSLINQYFL